MALDLEKIISEVDGSIHYGLPASPVEKAIGTNVVPDPGKSFVLTPDYLSFRNTWFGQPQPVSYKLLWNSFLSDPLVHACVEITTDAIIGDGFTISGKTELHVRRLQKLFEKVGFQKFLQDTVESLIIYGDSYAELIRDGGTIVTHFRPADTVTVRIDYDEHGNTIKYIQRVLHRRVDFYPDEMIHFSVNNVGGRVYGFSSLQSVIFTLQSKVAAQNFNTEYFRRNGLPRSLYLVKNLSDAQVNRMAATLRSATPQTDLLINASAGEVEHVIVAPNNQEMQFIELMNYLRQELIAAMGVPPLFLGITEGSNRANAQTQLEAWDRKKKKLRLMIQDIINMQLLTTGNFGFDDVRFKFNDENSREKLKYAQVAQLYNSIPWMTPDQILDTVGLPPLGDDSVSYNSVTGKINVHDSDIGDVPIYQIRQQMAMQAGGVGLDGRPNMPTQNGAQPQQKQEKKENAERLNSEQANETRKFAKANPAKDYPFGAREPERELTEPSMRRDFMYRLRMIAEAQVRNMRNINYEYDGVGEKDEKPNKPTLPVIGKPYKSLDAQGKAVFYKDTTQLDEDKS